MIPGLSAGSMLFPDKPLVLDLTRLLPGPYGTCLMAEAGMEVLKVESLEHGDALRTLTAVGEEEESLAYRLLNGKKRLVNLDPVSYTHLRAHETVLDLVCRLLLEKKKQTKN